MDFVSGRAKNQLALYFRDQLKSLGFPKLMRLQVGGENMIVVSDLEYVYSVILSRTTEFTRHPSFVKLLSYILGNNDHAKLAGLTRTVTPYVQEIRKIFLRAFQSNQLKKAMPKLDHVMQNMIDVIESKRDKGPIDFQDLCVRFTLDTIGVVAMDTNLGGLDGSRQIQKKIIDAGYVARIRTTIPFHELYCKLFPRSKAVQEQTKILNKLTAQWDALAQEILQKEDPPEGEIPLWYAMKTMKDPETGAPIAYESLLGEVGGMIVGGMDTTGHQLGWTLAMLASHPHIVDKLLEELREHGLYGENAREVVYEDLGELDYLSAVIKESMRTAHISNASLSREVPKDMTILGYRIPKGTMLLVPSNRSLMSKAVWGDPEVIRPERWLTGEDMTNKYFYIFSMGPRDCTGKRLAMLELRYATVKLITKYKLSMDVSFDELLENAVDGFVVESKNGIWLHASPRQASE